MKRRAATKPESGGARLMRLGKKPVVLGLTPEQHELASAVAKIEERAITEVILRYALRCLEQIQADPRRAKLTVERLS